MRAYQYRCNDYSLLTPLFKKIAVAPLIKFVPWGLPANIITLVSNTFIYAGLYLAMNPVSNYNTLLISFCMLAYLVGDHLDGMQAKRTGTGSALGEFCDHYLDAFNNGIISFTLFTAFGTTNTILIGSVIAISYLAHIAIFYEQFKTGWLTFEKLGSLEAVLLTVLIFALASIDVVDAWLKLNVIFSLTIFDLIMLGSAIGASLTFFNTIKRTPDVKFSFWIFCFLLSAVTILSFLLFDNFYVFVIVSLYASLYVGRVMRGHLVDGVERNTDLITPLYLLLFFLFDFLLSLHIGHLKLNLSPFFINPSKFLQTCSR